MARMRVSTTLVCAFVLVLLVVAPCAAAARALQGDLEGRRLSEGNVKSGDDAVPAAAKLADYESKYHEWVRFQEEQVTLDYTPAAANPSVPCCTP